MIIVPDREPIRDMTPEIDKSQGEAEQLDGLIEKFGLDARMARDGTPLSKPFRKFVAEGRSKCGYCGTLGGRSDGKCGSCGAPSVSRPATAGEVARELTELDGFVRRHEEYWGNVFLTGDRGTEDVETSVRRLMGFLTISRGRE